MSKIKLEKITVQVLGDSKNEEKVDLVYGAYTGDHTFVLGDEDAVWAVGETQECDNDTVCKLTAGDNSSEVKPNTLTSWILNTKAVEISLGESSYKINFAKV
ncbi:hypothetical protein AMS58_14355 [Pseudoalteromonas porphyrae]|uniref:hypothetical protein n=1 Tax=Pseudoalteromonas TaxID=53246 RepID=UPI0006BA7E2C|nr:MULTISPECIES: hypothetical protein [Pseudoalteromonas]KPH93954.1 hypothetical protein AMS58_14355 [Pseudoalteromonas porphyrae]